MNCETMETVVDKLVEHQRKIRTSPKRGRPPVKNRRKNRIVCHVTDTEFANLDIARGDVPVGQFVRESAIAIARVLSEPTLPTTGIPNPAG